MSAALGDEKDREHLEYQCDRHLSKLAGIYMRTEGKGAAVEEDQGHRQCTPGSRWERAAVLSER